MILVVEELKQANVAVMPVYNLVVVLSVSVMDLLGSNNVPPSCFKKISKYQPKDHNHTTHSLRAVLTLRNCLI